MDNAQQNRALDFILGSSNAKITIKEPVVADPQVAFEFIFDNVTTPVKEGWFFDLTIELWMDIDKDNEPDIIVAKVEINKLNPVKFDQKRLFFNIPFSDPNYKVGENIQIYFKLSGVDSDSRAFNIEPKDKDGNHFTVITQKNVPGVDEPCSASR